MDNINIYGDVSNVDLGNEIHKLEDQNRQLLQHIHKLEDDIQKLCTELISMKQIQQSLSKNISELYKTAKLEIQRKDRIISELREEIDNMILRKGGVYTNLKRELCNDEDHRIYKHHDHKRFKKDFNEENKTNSGLGKKMHSSRSTPDTPGDYPQFKLEKSSCEREADYKTGNDPRYNFYEENKTNPGPGKKVHSSRSTPDTPADYPQFKLEKISCERETDYKSANDHRYNSRYPLQRFDSSRNKRFDKANQRNQYRRGRSHERFNRSRSPDNYKRSRSSNKYRRSRSSNKFSRSRSSNRSDDIRRNRRSNSRFSTGKSSEHSNGTIANRHNYRNEYYNDEKMLVDIKNEVLHLTELEEGEIAAESDNNLIIEETNSKDSDYVNNIRTATSTSKLDVKAITIQEYRNRTKVISTDATNVENDLKIEDNNYLKVEKDNMKVEQNHMKIEKNNLKKEKHMKIERHDMKIEKHDMKVEKNDIKVEKNYIKSVPTPDSNTRDTVKSEDSFSEYTNKDIIPLNERNSNSMNKTNVDTIKSAGITDNASINTSVCSSSSENTSFNASGTNNGTRLRRRRCVVIGMKDKV